MQSAAINIFLNYSSQNGSVYFIFVRKYKGRQRLVFSTLPDENRGVVKVSISPKYFEKAVDILKFERVEDGKKTFYYTTSQEKFYTLMIYTFTLRVLKDKKKMNRLLDIILGLHYFELLFWANKLIYAKDYREEDRIARGFLKVYNI